MLILSIVKKDINNKDFFRFIGKPSDIFHLANIFNQYIAIIFPMTTGSLGVNQFATVAMERGLPPVFTVISAESLCSTCQGLLKRTHTHTIYIYTHH